VIRILHFSDVHVQERVTTMPLREFLTKRALAALNLWFSRGNYFREVPQKLSALAEFAKAEQIDLALCTGDYTALGTEHEHAQARRAIEPFTQLPQGHATVPGNHDLYLPDVLRDRRFERHFGELQHTHLPEYVVDGAYPFVRLVSDELAVVGINSARANPNPFTSAGRIPDVQLAALERVLRDVRLETRFVIVMTHYGILRRNGAPDHAHHGLENASELMRICNRPRLMLIHGHIHHRYAHPPGHGRPWLFCSGSATHKGQEGAWVYEFDGPRSRAVPVRFAEGRYTLEPGSTIPLV
jgi:3',5'-cyclic AMP phosphodiesterase CpdA